MKIDFFPSLTSVKIEFFLSSSALLWLEDCRSFTFSFNIINKTSLAQLSSVIGNSAQHRIAAARVKIEFSIPIVCLKRFFTVFLIINFPPENENNCVYDTPGGRREKVKRMVSVFHRISNRRKENELKRRKEYECETWRGGVVSLSEKICFSNTKKKEFPFLLTAETDKHVSTKTERLFSIPSHHTFLSCFRYGNSSTHSSESLELSWNKHLWRLFSCSNDFFLFLFYFSSQQRASPFNIHTQEVSSRTTTHSLHVEQPGCWASSSSRRAAVSGQ